MMAGIGRLMPEQLPYPQVCLSPGPLLPGWPIAMHSLLRHIPLLNHRPLNLGILPMRTSADATG